MKRVLSFSFCLLLLIFTALPCAAAAAPVRLDKELTEQETEHLDNLFNAVKDAYGIEAFFLINYDYSQGDEFQKYAAKYLDDNMAGEDAFVFALSSDSFLLDTRGKTKELLKSDDKKTFYAAVRNADENGEQYKAAVRFYDAVNTLLAERTGSDAAKPPEAAKAVVRTDDALTESETAFLTKSFDAIREAFGVEVFFVVNYDCKTRDELNTCADSFLDENRTGEDAFVFAVSGESYCIIKTGKAKELLESDDLDALYLAIEEADENGDQYEAAALFYEAVNALLAERTGKTAAIMPKEPGSVPIPDEISPVRGDRLVDQADLLNAEDEAALQKRLDDISERLKFDVVIVTCEHIGTRTPMEFADDYFDYNGFGYGKTYDGVVLLISMAERDWWISTSGYGEVALSDDYFMNYIQASDFYYALGNAHYKKSFNAFADTVEDFVTEAKANKPYSQHHKYHAWSNVKIGLIMAVAIGLVSAALVTIYQYKNYTGFVRSKAEAGDYMVGGVNLTVQTDEYRYNKVYRTKRVKTESSSSTSGGSSSYHSSGHHSSSSGRSHGGGGGKF